MMSRATTPENLPPYLYNPRNGRVMITTQAKFDRVDEHDNPYFIPCDSLEGPDGEVEVETASTTDAPPVVESVPEADASQEEVKGPSDLIEAVMASVDKDELVAIGKTIDVKLTRAMKIETMQKHLAARIEELGKL